MDQAAKAITAFGLGAALVPTGVLAQDVSTNAMPTASFVDMWTGFSVGGGIGANFFAGSPMLSFSDDYTGDFNGTSAFDYSSQAIFGTAEAGYDHAFSNGVVVGLYGDVSFGDTVENFNYSDSDEGKTLNLNGSIRFKEQFSLTGRLGFRVTDAFILYGLAGYSNQRFEASLNHDLLDTDEGDYTGSGSTSGRMEYLTVGGGFEAFVTDRTTVKFEYRYGHSNGATVSAQADSSDYTSSFDTGAITKQSIRAVMSLKF